MREAISGTGCRPGDTVPGLRDTNIAIRGWIGDGHGLPEERESAYGPAAPLSAGADGETTASVSPAPSGPGRTVQYSESQGKFGLGIPHPRGLDVTIFIESYLTEKKLRWPALAR